MIYKIDNIGKNIFTLRKKNGITQEVLANELNISTQAVSKWENGGVPDVEMLPKIADYFNVPIDFLFKGENKENDIADVINNYFFNVDRKDLFEKAFELCWHVHNALFQEENTASFETMKKKIRKDRYSGVITDQGVSLMGLSENLPYFALFPDSNNDEELLDNNINYCDFFKDLGDKEFFDFLIFLYRDGVKSVTPHYLEKQLNITQNQAVDLLNRMSKHRFVQKSEVETGEGKVDVFRLIPNPNIKPFLAFSKVMITPSRNYIGYLENRYKTFLR